MQAPHPQAQRLLAALGQHLDTQLNLQQGVCALYDRQGREAVVIEIPPHSESVILHCGIDVPPHAPDLHKRLLMLNFRLDTLRGCWLALNEQGEVRLCAQTPLDSLGEERFCHWVVGFISQVGETRDLLMQRQPSATPRRTTLA